MAYEGRKIDTQRAIKYLNHAFKHACEDKMHILGRNPSKGSELKQFQEDYSYIINEIVLGPNYFASKYISDANEVIAKIKELEPKTPKG
jgi:hypothetical protein